MFSSVLLTLSLIARIVSATPTERRAPTSSFPSPPTTSHLSAPITVKAGKIFTPPTAYTRYDRGSGACTGQKEGGDKDAVFILEEGATLSRVVIGKDQAEGVHCLGSCTIEYVFFEDVCEDAITVKQKAGTTRISYGGAKHASDKVVQHNGGGTVIINNFYVEDFGKLYRSCGNCKTQYARTVQINDVLAVDGKLLAGINSNLGDTATIRTTKVDNVKDVCTRFNGNNTGKEPTKIGSGPDGKSCKYTTSDVTEL